MTNFSTTIQKQIKEKKTMKIGRKNIEWVRRGVYVWRSKKYFYVELWPAYTGESIYTLRFGLNEEETIMNEIENGWQYDCVKGGKCWVFSGYAQHHACNIVKIEVLR